MVKFFSFDEINDLQLTKGMRFYFDNFSEGIKNLIEENKIDKKALGFDNKKELVLKYF